MSKTKGSDLNETLAELAEELRCPICYNLFIDPRTLNCGHSFCTECLRKYYEKIGKNNWLDCPVCRNRTTVPTRNILDLPKNIALANSVEKLKKGYSDNLSISGNKNVVFPTQQPWHSSLLQPQTQPPPLYPNDTIFSPSAPPVEDENEHNINQLEFPTVNKPTTSLECDEQQYLAYLAQKQYQEDIDRQLAMSIQNEEDANFARTYSNQFASVVPSGQSTNCETNNYTHTSNNNYSKNKTNIRNNNNAKTEKGTEQPKLQDMPNVKYVSFNVISMGEVHELFRKWVRSLWFVPKNFSEGAHLEQIVAAYVPYWKYDVVVKVHYTAQLFRVVQDGKERNSVNAQHRSEWHSSSGDLSFSLEGHICAVSFDEEPYFYQLIRMCDNDWNLSVVNQSDPWNFAKFIGRIFGNNNEVKSPARPPGQIRVLTPIPWDTLFKQIIEPDINLRSYSRVETELRSKVIRFRNLQDNVQIVKLTKTLIYWPVYLCFYFFEKEEFHCIINAQTKDLYGTRPYSRAARVVLTTLEAVDTIGKLISRWSS
jgi:DNA-directed RNA polymerase subunit RPC12/RpoP